MQRHASKQTIAIDIDDVLAANAEGFAEFSNKKWGTNLTPDDYTEHWAELWKVDEEEVERRRQEIIKAKLFIKHSLFEDSKEALRRLSANYRLVIVSSRGRSVQKDTVEWISREYRGIFKEIHFARIWDEPDMHTLEKLKLTKTEICKEIGADYLVDDQPKHCLAAAEAGITAILFGDYKWNRGTKLLTNMVRAKSWSEVLDFFNEKS